VTPDSRSVVVERLRRVRAIVRADFLIRFRRQSTLIVFLLLSGLAYLSVPHPDSGQALLVVGDGRRALYTSAAIGMATAMIVTIFVGLAGFYAISNAIGQDVRTRCGAIIASTTVRSGEYLVAKLVGNLVFLGTFALGLMLSSMLMLVVRHEAALEPWVFARQYALLVPPALVLVAVLALVFESVPFLAGRAGDVVYFVLYLLCLSLPVLLMVDGRAVGLARYLDFGGLAFTLEEMRPLMQTPNLSIGGSFDASKLPIDVPGVTLRREWLLPRLVTCLVPFLLLAVARATFHRFDPARVASDGGAGRAASLLRVNAAVKRAMGGFSPSAVSIRPAVRQPSVLLASALDARMMFTAYPLMTACALGLAVLTLTTPADVFMTGVLPAAFGVAGLAIADVPCRERRAGTIGLIRAAPLLKRHFVRWKLGSAAFVALAFLLVPLARLMATRPSSVLPAVVGLFLVLAMATSLGVIAATPKAFTVVFLTMMYIVTADRGASPALDFAGFYGVATAGVTATWAAIAASVSALGHVVYAARLRREDGGGQTQNTDGQRAFGKH
jgi:hypothetical protein